MNAEVRAILREITATTPGGYGCGDIPRSMRVTQELHRWIATHDMTWARSNMNPDWVLNWEEKLADEAARGEHGKP